MNKTQTPEDYACHRLHLITPLLEEELDNSRLIALNKKISQDNGLSYRTISRYHQAYLKECFAGLKPKRSYRCKHTKLPDHFPQELKE